jgi:hypothetical protein
MRTLFPEHPARESLAEFFGFILKEDGEYNLRDFRIQDCSRRAKDLKASKETMNV